MKMINIDHPVGALKTQLGKLLLSVDRVGWETGATTGRFDNRRTSRMLAGSERVFKSRVEVEAVTTAVSIIIDMSSSMHSAGQRMPAYRMGQRIVDDDPDSHNNTRIGVASQCAYAIATAVERSNCQVEVNGFKSGGNMFIAKGEGMTGLGGQTVACKGTRGSEGADVINIKSFSQRTPARRKAFEYLYHAVSGGTPDYHGVRTVVEDMSRRTEHRKIVIVVTDGLGDFQAMKQLCEQSEKLFGVTIIALGVQTERDYMEMAYTRFACVQNVKELTDVAIRELINQIKSTKVVAE